MWEKTSASEIISYDQFRAAHMRWDNGRNTIAAKGPGHGHVTTIYRLISGESKWAGIKTNVRFNEHDFQEVFLGSAGKLDRNDNAVIEAITQ